MAIKTELSGIVSADKKHILIDNTYLDNLILLYFDKKRVKITIEEVK